MQARRNLFEMLDDPGDETDIWRYGWRYVADPAMPERLLQQPLTLEDVLHPLEEDIWLSTDLHSRDMRYLHNVAESQLEHEEHSLVLSDCRIAWDEEGEYAHRPDLAVFRNVNKPRQNWATFNVVREGCRPRLLLEITSPSTRMLDLVSKIMEYEEQGVNMYVIADGGRTVHRESPRLSAYRHNGDLFVKVLPDRNGRLWLDLLGVFLGWEGDRLVCYLPDGQPIPEYDVLKRQHAREAERADDAVLELGKAQEEVKKEQRLRQAAEDEATRFAERIRELEALLNPQPPASSQ